MLQSSIEFDGWFQEAF